jgi:hypothetical protein
MFEICELQRILPRVVLIMLDDLRLRLIKFNLELARYFFLVLSPGFGGPTAS